MRRIVSLSITLSLAAVLVVASPASASGSGPDLSGFVPDFTKAIPFLASGTSTLSPVGGVTVTATTNTGVGGGGNTYLYQSNSRLQTILTFSPPIPGFKVQTRNHTDCATALGAPPSCFEQFDFVGKDSSNTVVFQSSIRNSNETTSYVPGATNVGSLTGLISTLQIDYSHDTPAPDFLRGSYLDLWLTDSSIAPATQTVTGNPGTPITPTTAYTATGLAGAVTYAITSGTLPDGLVLNPTTGVITGTPTETSSATVTITATGASFGQASATVTFSVTLSVTYDAQGGTSPAGGTRSTTAGATLASLATTSRAGYTFVGWFTASSGGTQVTTSAGHGQTGNFTLYAQWTANTLTVSTNEQGGSAVADATTTTGASMSSPGESTRTGYAFAGWFTAASGGSAISFPYAHGQTGNFTLYAQWTANSLTVTTDEQGGSAIGDASTTTGASMGSPGTPSREGYTFNGWFTASSGGSAISFPYAHGQTADFTLFAQWRRLPEFAALSGPATVNTSFGLVASSGDYVLTLVSDTPEVCRTVGLNVVFVAPGACRVRALSGDVVMHSFDAQVQAPATAMRRRGGQADPASPLRVLNSAFVYFGPDSAVLTPAARAELRRLVVVLRAAGAVTVTGHAADDGDPSDRIALGLSRRRAQAVADFFDVRGIAVTIRGAFGKSLPASDSDRALNRRVEVAWYAPQS